MNPAESLALIAAFCGGVLFMLAASRPLPQAPAQPAGERAPEPQGKPIIGAPPGWKR